MDSKLGQQVAVLPDVVREHLDQRIADGKLELPLLPEVTWEIVAACDSPDTDSDKIAKILHRDPGMAGNVLKIANSPISGTQVQIVSLQQAVSRLGMRQIAEIALAVSVEGKLFDVPSRQGLVRAMWKHSLGVGLFCKEIARARRSNVETAYLCGLLHDMGKPVLLLPLTELEERIKQTLERSIVLRALDIYHTQVGSLLATEWKLSDEVAEAILHHHDCRDASDKSTQEAAATVELADTLAHWKLQENLSITLEELSDLPCVGMLNLYPNDVEKLVDASERIADTIEAMD